MGFLGKWLIPGLGQKITRCDQNISESKEAETTIVVFTSPTSWEISTGQRWDNLSINKNNDCDGLKQIKCIKIHKFRMLLLKTGKLWSFLWHQLIFLKISKQGIFFPAFPVIIVFYINQRIEERNILLHRHFPSNKCRRNYKIKKTQFCNT